MAPVSDKPKAVPLADFEAALDSQLYDAMTCGEPVADAILVIAERRAKAKRIGQGGTSAGPGIDSESLDIISKATEEARNAGGTEPDMTSGEHENERD